MTPITNPSSFDSKVLSCGLCDKTFTVHNSLTRHRDRYHSKHHTCYVCDSVNGKLIEGVKIKTHLAEAHGLEDTQSCGCCHYIFPSRQQLEAHRTSLRNTGHIGNEVILAKSDNEPGNLKQENMTDKHQKYLMESFGTSEDKENESGVVILPPNKSSRKRTFEKVIKPSIEKPRNAKKAKRTREEVTDKYYEEFQEFFTEFVIPVLTEFHERQQNGQN